MIRVAIIEDETIAARNLERLLLEVDMEITVVAKIESVKDAVNLLPNLQVELILMDIHLLDGSAFKIFEYIEIDTPIIFTTAFDKYVLRAFKHNSVDYLLKPIVKDDLEIAINKYKKIFSGKSQNGIDYRELISLLGNQQPSYKKRFLIQIGKKLLSINTADIAYFFVEHRATYIKSFDNKSYILDSSLSNLEENLDPDNFFRINRQLLISRQSIKNIFYHSSIRLKLNLTPDSNESFWVSGDKISKFKKWLNK